MTSGLSLRAVGLKNVYWTVFPGRNQEQPLHLSGSAPGECEENVLGDDVIVLCVLREPFHKPRVM